jgi:hypothetical protein
MSGDDLDVGSAGAPAGVRDLDLAVSANLELDQACDGLVGGEVQAQPIDRTPLLQRKNG